MKWVKRGKDCLIIDGRNVWILVVGEIYKFDIIKVLVIYKGDNW